MRAPKGRVWCNILQVPAGDRAFAGYRAKERVDTNFFGDVYAGVAPDGVTRVRITVVRAELASAEGFADSLLHFNRAFALLEHPNLVTPQKAERGENGELVVITGDSTAVVFVSELGNAARDEAIALAIADGLIRAVAHVHAAGLLVGAFHVQGAWIDSGGAVRLTDGALGRALVTSEIDERELEDRRLIVAPELRSGHKPSARSDVFALATLLSKLPGIPAAMTFVVDRALSDDPRNRYESAVEFEEAWTKAIDTQARELASVEAVAEVVGASGAPAPAAASLDDVLDGLSSEIELPSDEEREAAEMAAVAAIDDILGSAGPTAEPVPEARAEGVPEPLTGPVTAPARPAGVSPVASEPAPPPSKRSSPRAAPIVAPALTPIAGTAAISQPAPAAEPSPSTAPQDDEAEKTAAEVDALLDGGALDLAEEQPAVSAAPTEAVVPPPRPASAPVVARAVTASELAEMEPQAISVISQPVADELLAQSLAPRKRGAAVVWLGAAVVAVACAFGYVWTQTDVFHPERARAKAEAAERERLAREKVLRAKVDKPGTVVINADQGEAAVWLLLGRTPLETFPLPASRTNDLRFIHDGFRDLDLPVTGPMWVGEGKELHAAIHARLEAGERETALPPYPADPEADPPPGPEGQGPIRVESTPSGAQVWLLVGFTPTAEIAGLVAGKTYEFMVLKDGFQPSFAVFKDASWFLSGEAGIGKVKSRLEQDLVLARESKKSRRR